MERPEEVSCAKMMGEPSVSMGKYKLFPVQTSPLPVSLKGKSKLFAVLNQPSPSSTPRTNVHQGKPPTTGASKDISVRRPTPMESAQAEWLSNM